MVIISLLAPPVLASVVTDKDPLLFPLSGVTVTNDFFNMYFIYILIIMINSFPNKINKLNFFIICKQNNNIWSII